jgi:NAD(P)-dependent dehydrogenase (short-subunit alcohol dehydrogenase family)
MLCGNVHEHAMVRELTLYELSLEGQVAIVTGAGRGIGRAIAVAFAEAGADVAVASRTVEELESAAEEVRGLGRRALVVPTDVTDEAAVRALVERTVAELGALDVMVNNAGVAPFMETFMDTRPEGFLKYFRANFEPCVFGTRAAGEVLLAKGTGCVLNLASIDGFRAERELSYYSAAKAAVISLTKTTALEWASAGVRVNAIAPGWIDTPMNAPEREDPEAEARILGQIPMGRWGRPEEIAAAAVFLCSPAAAFITGEVLVVDGGQTITSEYGA